MKWQDVATVALLAALAGWLAHVESQSSAALVVLGTIGGFIARGPAPLAAREEQHGPHNR